MISVRLRTVFPSSQVLPNDQQQLGDKRRRQIVAGFGRAFGVGGEQAVNHARRSPKVCARSPAGNTGEYSGAIRQFGGKPFTAISASARE